MLEARTGHVEKEHLSQEEQPQPVQGQKRHQPGPPRLLPGLRSKPARLPAPASLCGKPLEPSETLCI